MSFFKYPTKMRADTIEIKGIHRSINAANPVPGGCHDVQNLRFKDGGWRPVRTKRRHKTLQAPFEYNKIVSIHKHDVSSADEYILYAITYGGSKRIVHAYYQNDVADQITSLRGLAPDETLIDIAFIDNIMVVTSDKRKTYHIWRNGQYLLNRSMDQFVDFSFTLNTEESRELEPISGGSGDIETQIDVAYANYLEAISKEEENGFIEGEMFICFAWRMKDGSFIKHSMPYWYQTPAVYAQINPRVRPTFDANLNLIDVHVGKASISVNIGVTSGWSEVVDSLCVFSTPYRSVHNITTNFQDYDRIAGGQTGGRFIYRARRRDAEEHLRNSLFYLVEEIPLTDAGVTKDIKLDYKNIVTKETLPPDQLTHHEISGNVSYIYNGRLHLGNLFTNHYRGHEVSVNNYTLPETSKVMSKSWVLGRAAFSADLSVQVNKSSETQVSFPTNNILPIKMITGVLPHLRYPADTWNLMFWPLLAYPHPNASRIEIWDRAQSPQQRIVSSNLKKHPFYSFSYWLNLDENGWPRFIRSKAPLHPAERPSSRLSLPPETRELKQRNVVRVSEVQNPFVYPAINTYRLGIDESNEVLNMGVQSMPTSEGQFGQFPLAVFLSGGIDILDAGQGGVLYGSIRNISRAKSQGGIIETDNGIFFSTKDGLFVLSGRTVAEATRNLQGRTTESLVPSSDSVSFIMPNITDFNSFILGSNFMFDDQHNEVVIYKEGADYTVRFSPSTMNFFRASGGFTGHYVSRGIYYGYNIPGFATISDMNNDVERLQNIHIGFQTNPVIHQARSLKKLTQSRLAGLILIPSTQTGLKYRIFGSNRYSVDLPPHPSQIARFNKRNEFSLIQEYVLAIDEGAIMPITADTHEYTADTHDITADVVSIAIEGTGLSSETHEISMLTGRAHQSVIYLIYQLGGIVRSDSVISEIQTSIEDRFNRKMR